MAWLSRLLSTLLVITLTATIFSIILNQTVLSSHYLEAKLTQTNSYSRLSTAISNQVAQDAGIANPTLANQLSLVITPAVVKAKVNSTIEQSQAYYRGNGPLPTIDFTEIGSQLQAAGVPLSSNSPLTKPISLGHNSTNQAPRNNPQRMLLITLFLSIVLAGLLALVCWHRRNFLPFSRVLISIGITTGLIALCCLVLPGVIDHAVKFSANSNLFEGVVHDVAVAITHDLGKRFGDVALVALVVGIASHLMLKRHMKQRLQTVMTPGQNPRPLTR